MEKYIIDERTGWEYELIGAADYILRRDHTGNQYGYSDMFHTNNYIFL